jgi:hypothetical protein
MNTKGWEQVKAGIALITFSKLASWDCEYCRFISSTSAVFETQARQFHAEFGRLICWITFSVGAEYIAKGVCINVLKLEPRIEQKVVSLPGPSEDITRWIDRLSADDPLLKEKKFFFPTLGNLRVDQVPKSKSEQRLVKVAFKTLASSIRNRDAHLYTKNVRQSHHHLVEGLFVPAMNVLLASLNPQCFRLIR